MWYPPIVRRSNLAGPDQKKTGGGFRQPVVYLWWCFSWLPHFEEVREISAMFASMLIVPHPMWGRESLRQTHARTEVPLSMGTPPLRVIQVS